MNKPSSHSFHYFFLIISRTGIKKKSITKAAAATTEHSHMWQPPLFFHGAPFHFPPPAAVSVLFPLSVAGQSPQSAAHSAALILAGHAPSRYCQVTATARKSHLIRAAASSFVLPGLFHFVAGINLACFLSRQAPPMRKGAYLKLYTRHSFVRGKASATAANLNLLPPKGCINLA